MAKGMADDLETACHWINVVQSDIVTCPAFSEPDDTHIELERRMKMPKKEIGPVVDDHAENLLKT